MKAFHITHAGGLDALRPVELDEPHGGDHDAIVSMKAWSLNYRDLAMPHVGYIANDKPNLATQSYFWGQAASPFLLCSLPRALERG